MASFFCAAGDRVRGDCFAAAFLVATFLAGAGVARCPGFTARVCFRATARLPAVFFAEVAAAAFATARGLVLALRVVLFARCGARFAARADV